MCVGQSGHGIADEGGVAPVTMPRPLSPSTQNATFTRSPALTRLSLPDSVFVTGAEKPFQAKTTR